MKPWPLALLAVLALILGGLGRLAANSQTTEVSQTTGGLRFSLHRVTKEANGYAAVIRVSAPDIVEPRLHAVNLVGSNSEVCPNGRLADIESAPDHTDLTVFFPASECFEAIPRSKPVKLAGVFEGAVHEATIRATLELGAAGF